MPGRATAVSNGSQLQSAVAALATELALDVRREVRAGRRLWGKERKIDLVLTQPGSGKRLGVECKFQAGSGSADEKVPATIRDIESWPIPGIVVFSGAGFDRTKSYLYATGKAVELTDLEDWLRLYFGLELTK
jgi:hypothetical protein